MIISSISDSCWPLLFVIEMNVFNLNVGDTIKKFADDIKTISEQKSLSTGRYHGISNHLVPSNIVLCWFRTTVKSNDK